MKIGIDARMAGHSGIGTYVRGLLRGLAGLETGHDFVLFTAPDASFGLPESARFRIQPCRVPVYGMREQTQLRRELLQARCDLYHVPHFNAPLAFPAPLVITIHDLIHLRYPEFLRSRGRALVARFLLRQAVRRARAVVAVSGCTGADLEARLGVPSWRITVVHEGVDARFAPSSEAELAAFRSGHGLDAPFLLYVGLLRPHKNLVRLVQAYALYEKRVPGALRLVLWGRRDRRYPEIDTEIAARGLRDKVRIVEEHLPESYMPLLYGAAAGFVLPSLFEGFGLPPLEAMACGVPVLASSAGALPEVLDGAALFVPPLDVEALARGLERIAHDGGLRAALRERGLQHARRFTWDETARQTLRVYERAAAR